MNIIRTVSITLAATILICPAFVQGHERRGPPVGAATSTTYRQPGQAVYAGTVTATVYLPISPAECNNVGTNEAEVQGQFPTMYLCNVQANPDYDANFRSLDDYMLAALSNEYQRNGGDVDELLATFAQTLSPDSLVRARSAFGAAVDAAVAAYANADIQATYFATPSTGFIPMSQAQYLSAGLSTVFAPYFPSEFSMTQYDLFLEYFAVEGATISSALVRTAFFESTVLYSAYQFSYFVGTKLSAILDHVDPNINIELGNIIGAGVDDVVDSVSSLNSPTGTAYVDLPGFYDDIPSVDASFDAYSWEPTTFYMQP